MSLTPANLAQLPHWKFGPLPAAQVADIQRQAEAIRSEAREVERTRFIEATARLGRMPAAH